MVGVHPAGSTCYVQAHTLSMSFLQYDQHAAESTPFNLSPAPSCYALSWSCAAVYSSSTFLQCPAMSQCCILDVQVLLAVPLYLPCWS